jgi:hypothetical protein
MDTYRLSRESAVLRVGSFLEENFKSRYNIAATLPHLENCTFELGDRQALLTFGGQVVLGD